MTFSPRETERPAVNATRARQGRWGRQVFWVLVFGTLLAALGMFAAWTWKSADEGPPRCASSRKGVRRRQTGMFASLKSGGASPPPQT